MTKQPGGPESPGPAVAKAIADMNEDMARALRAARDALPATMADVRKAIAATEKTMADLPALMTRMREESAAREEARRAFADEVLTALHETMTAGDERAGGAPTVDALETWLAAGIGGDPAGAPEEVARPYRWEVTIPQPGGGTATMHGAMPVAPSVCDAHEEWSAAPEDERGPHPMEGLVSAWQNRPQPLKQRRLIVTEERKPPEGRNPLVLSRAPGALHLATLAAVEVDGEPFVSDELDAQTLRRYRVVRPDQAELFPGPRTLDGNATGGVLVEAVAGFAADGDERSPLRPDVLRLGTLAFALTGAVTLEDWEGAVLAGGTDTPANRRRFNRAARALRYLGIEGKPGMWWAMVDAEPGSVNRIGPPRWWLDAMRAWDRVRMAKGRKARAEAEKEAKRLSGGTAWRLTGGLFRPALAGEEVAQGTRIGYWGAVNRTVAGIEGGLLWGPSAGKGLWGRLPDNLRPPRRGGPGPENFVPWWQVLRLAGEHVGPDASPKGAKGRRYRRRVEMLRAAGYFTTRTGTAPAGDTVEIVEARRGARAQPAGLVVRASARFCAAYAKGGERVRIPADRALS